MQARFQYDGAISGSFPINKGVKQGCVLAPTLFRLYFSYVFWVTNSNLVSFSGVSLLSRDDGNFFNLSRFKAKSRTQRVIVSELLYADDAALCATSADQLQNLLDCFSSSCDKFGLTISLKKTATMSQSTEGHHFTINKTTLDDVEKFRLNNVREHNIGSGNRSQTWQSFHGLWSTDQTCLEKSPPEYPY